jgi:hypothetical protein
MEVRPAALGSLQSPYGPKLFEMPTNVLQSVFSNNGFLWVLAKLQHILKGGKDDLHTGNYLENTVVLPTAEIKFSFSPCMLTFSFRRISARYANSAHHNASLNFSENSGFSVLK